MISLDILPIAQIEYQRAVDWYLEQSPGVADRFVSQVESAIESIHRYPNQQLRWDETYHFRLLNKFPYYVAFQSSPNKVVIVAIRHTAQDQDVWKGR